MIIDKICPCGGEINQELEEVYVCMMCGNEYTEDDLDLLKDA